jgi:phage shock protein A
LRDWLRENETDVREITESAQGTFDEVRLDDLRSIFSEVWDGQEIMGGELVGGTVVQQATIYETCRKLLHDTDLWSQLRTSADRLRDEHPRSPTTKSVANTLESSRPPSPSRVEQLIEEAKDPKPAGAQDDVWVELQRIADDLSQTLPNASITDDVTAAVDAEDRPSEDRARELLSAGKEVLARKREIDERLDQLEDGSIVLIDESE